MAAKADGEFQIALAMSGAISAGAYTAGVFDFLIQALDEWENAKTGKYLEKEDDPGTIPNHFVGIKAMSGASAGAATAAIGAIALAAADQKPIVFDTHRAGEQKIKCYLPMIYEAWVVKPGLVAEGEEKLDFLQTSDLDGAPEAAGDFSRTRDIPPAEGEPRPVTSLLNSRLLDAIVGGALDVMHVTDSPRPYISKTLHIYMTLSNLRGVPYSDPFGGGTYHMISHGDRVHYAVAGLGTWDSKSDFADNDQKRPIDAALLKIPKNPDWRDYAVCALASAAFPVGLAPRQISATIVKPDEYDGRRLPIDSVANYPTRPPAWLAPVRAEKPFWFTTADGGIIDNDPFEYARFSLKDGGKLDQRIEPDLEKVDRAVIMVSPFPELKPLAPQGQPAPDLVGSLAALLPALIDQARFKPSEIILAADEKHGSRYLIGPRRVIDDGTPNGKEQRYGIASGLLGGFGGFVARSFRDHDFQLGRRNCQRFLQDAFALPGGKIAGNKIIEGWSEGARRAFTTISSQDYHPIIPLVGTAKPEVVLQPWPRISQVQFEVLQTRIAERFDAVAPKLLAQNVTGPLHFLLWLAVRPFPRGIGLIRNKVLDFVKASILADLVRRDMIDDWRLPPNQGRDGDEIRLVLAELINPSYDLRNVAGLCRTAGLDRAKVEAVLALGQSPVAAGQSFEVWRAPWTDKNKGPLYTLMSRKPRWHRWLLWRLFGLVKGLDAWLAKPAVDKPGV